MEIKGTVLLKKMKWLRHGGNLLFTILYLWNAELTLSFIKYEVMTHASGWSQMTLDKQYPRAPHKEDLRPSQPVGGQE